MRTIFAFLLAGVTAYGAQINLLTEATTVATNDFVAKDQYTTNGYVARKVSFTNFRTELQSGTWTADGATVNDYLTLEQGSMTPASGGTNYGIDLATAVTLYKEVTNHVCFTGTTNAAAGRVMWCLLNNTSTNDYELTIPSTWFQKGFASQKWTMTNGTASELFLYCYGTASTNVYVKVDYLTK